MQNLYLLALLPPAPIAEQIEAIRRECAEKYNVTAALKPPVHLTLHRPFKLEPHLEKHLLKLLSPASVHNSFTIALENFGSFNSHTVFIHVLKHPGLTSLYKKISAIISRNKLDPKEINNSGSGFAPHITIAYRDIPAETFPAIWEEFNTRKFKRPFTVASFSLLKHDGKQWRVLREFMLKDEPVALTLF